MGRLHSIREHLQTLRGQTLVAVVGIHALFIPLLFAGLVFFVTQSFTEQFVNQSRTAARLLAALVPEDLDPQELDSIFYEATLSGPLVQAEIATPGNDIQWSLTDPVADAQIPDFREDFFFGQHGDGVYFIATPLPGHADNPPRQLRLGFDETPTRQQVHALYARAGALTLGYLVLTLGLAAYWIYRLNRPIRELGNASRRVASGEVDEAIDVQTGVAEIRSLAADINHMRQQLLKKTDSMEHLAMHDGLTGLPNRSLLMDRVEQTIKEAERQKTPVALLLMDLDHFKEINDTLGHAVGDHILCMLPQRLRPCLREVDTLARLGGDEFAFVLPNTGRQGAVKVAGRLAEAMQAPFQVQGQNLHLGMSVGIALYPSHGDEFNTLLRQVDIAMYAAKANRRDYFVYSADIDPHSRDRLALASELRRDMEAGNIEVHYQPQIRLADRSFCAVEALCRWPHAERGYIPPEQFIPLASRLGLMDELAREVIRRALRDFSSHDDLQGLTLCINLAANNLHDPALPGFLDDCMMEFRLSPESIVLEITEQEYMTEPGDALRHVAALRDRGFGLAIDDFGTGHSPFTYLKHLPVTELKVDKSFVADMVRDRHDYSLVAAIIALGQKLGLSVVAEGVQDQATLELLLDLECDRAQGFYFARPMPIDELTRFIAEHARRDPT
jgi:diguanylate cyclase (GGDEF)-like protein